MWRSSRPRPLPLAACRAAQVHSAGVGAPARRQENRHERSHPGAAASLREGLAETLTVTRLGVKGKLRKTLTSTNPCESMIECVRRTARNVKHWQNGEMCLRWTAAGMLEAEHQFRRVIGYQDLAKLAAAVEREGHPSPARPRSDRGGRYRRRRVVTSTRTVTEVPHRPGHPPCNPWSVYCCDLPTRGRRACAFRRAAARLSDLWSLQRPRRSHREPAETPTPCAGGSLFRACTVGILKRRTAEHLSSKC
jgi:hypothetical protein